MKRILSLVEVDFAVRHSRDGRPAAGHEHGLLASDAGSRPEFQPLETFIARVAAKLATAARAVRASVEIGLLARLLLLHFFPDGRGLRPVLAIASAQIPRIDHVEPSCRSHGRRQRLSATPKTTRWPSSSAGGADLRPRNSLPIWNGDSSTKSRQSSPRTPEISTPITAVPKTSDGPLGSSRRQLSSRCKSDRIGASQRFRRRRGHLYACGRAGHGDLSRWK